MVGKHHLRGERLVALVVLGQQGQQVQLHGAIPVEELRVGVVFLQLLTLHGVTAHDLTLEVIVANRVVGIHQWCGGIGLDGILEHAPVGIVAINDARSHVGRNREESVLGGMHDGSTCTILLALRTQVDAVGIAVVGTHAVVTLVVAAA